MTHALVVISVFSRTGLLSSSCLEHLVMPSSEPEYSFLTLLCHSYLFKDRLLPCIS